MVQEALTNVLRHAPEAAATVRIVVTADHQTVVQVLDDGPGGVAGERRGYGDLLRAVLDTVLGVDPELEGVGPGTGCRPWWSPTTAA